MEQRVAKELKVPELTQGRYVLCSCFEPQALAFVTTRCSGMSKMEYASFNLAHHVGDNLVQVQSNRELVSEEFALTKLCFMNQTHSSKVIVVDESNLNLNTEFDCDSLVTKLAHVGLAVMTADCLPLLLCDTSSKVVAAVHCGWRGIERGIIANTLESMQRLGSKPSSTKAYLGPAIGPQSFEVGLEVERAFVAQSDIFAQAFSAEYLANDQGELSLVPDKRLCDIYKLVTLYLTQAGLEESAISCEYFDTKQQTEYFYSYRASKVTGRMASIIALRS